MGSHCTHQQGVSNKVPGLPPFLGLPDPFLPQAWVISQSWFKNYCGERSTISCAREHRFYRTPCVCISSMIIPIENLYTLNREVWKNKKPPAWKWPFCYSESLWQIWQQVTLVSLLSAALSSLSLHQTSAPRAGWTRAGWVLLSKLQIVCSTLFHSY